MIGGVIVVGGLLLVFLAGVLLVSPDFLRGWTGPVISTVDAARVFVVLSLVTVGFPALAWGGLLIWISAKAYQGRNWARVIATILLAIAAFLSLPLVLRHDASGVEVLLGSLGPILMAMSVLLFWLPSSNAWYRQSSAEMVLPEAGRRP